MAVPALPWPMASITRPRGARGDVGIYCRWNRPGYAETMSTPGGCRSAGRWRLPRSSRSRSRSARIPARHQKPTRVPPANVCGSSCFRGAQRSEHGAGEGRSGHPDSNAGRSRNGERITTQAMGPVGVGGAAGGSGCAREDDRRSGIREVEPEGGLFPRCSVAMTTTPSATIGGRRC